MNDGTLKNQGLLELPSLSTNGFASDTDGKLGSCCTGYGIYHFDEDFLNNSWTIALWVKTTNWRANNDILLCKNADVSTSSQFYFSVINGKAFNLGINGGSSATQYSYTFNTDQWYHLAATYDGQRYALYINGDKVKTGERTASKIEGHLNLGISCRSNNVSGTSMVGYTAKKNYNDIRIYDNALSELEVKHLSQGLVLHYLLDNNGVGNKNISSKYVSCAQGNPDNTNNGGRTKYYGDYGIIIPAVEKADTFFTIWTTEPLENGQIYTLSANVSGLIEGTYYRFPLFAQGNSSKRTICFDHNGRNSLTFTMNYTGTIKTVTVDGETYYQLFMDDVTRDIASGQGEITINNIKLEKGNKATPWCPNPSDDIYTALGYDDGIEYDTSGYGNNGIKNNSPTYSIDSPRYLASTHLDGVNQTIQLPNLLTLIPDSIFTFNIWFKRLESEPNSKPWETILGGPSGFELETCSANVHDNKIKAYSWGNGSFEFEFDKWNMLTMVSNGTNTLFYLNGELKLTGTYKSLVSGTYFIGSWKNTSSQNYKGYVSDAKIFATALSDSEIQKLYTVSASIDSNGNAYSAAYVEG